MKIFPEIYSYKRDESISELEVYPILIESCLELFKAEEKLQLIEFGATSYKNYGWVDHNNFKQFDLVSDLKDLFATEGDIGLVICHAVVGGWCTLKTRADGHVVFQVSTDKRLNTLIGKLAGSKASLVISQVKKFPGQFVKIGTSSNIEKFSSIKQYLEKQYT
jgi:hypothetical protein